MLEVESFFSEPQESAIGALLDGFFSQLTDLSGSPEDTLLKCTDKIDNDNDGQFDCGDPQCRDIEETCCLREFDNATWNAFSRGPSGMKSSSPGSPVFGVSSAPSSTLPVTTLAGGTESSRAIVQPRIPRGTGRQ